jgi:2-polyprenyl-3-methyl-5-hydroxy-6-metoxy-1,4-benzoquinol methylase
MSSVHDHLNKLIAARPEIAPLASGLADNNPDYLQVVDEPARLITHLCGGDEARIEQALQGYIQFCDTFKQKQMDFLRNRRYGYTDYQRMNAEVYQDRDYMERVYYPALLFSYLLSSNYFDILRAFGQQFIPRCLAASGQSCEVGIGHGLLSALLLRSNRGLRGHGLDICPAARSMAERTSRFFGVNPPVEVRVADAAEGIEFQDNDVMICAEVMEHLPDPSRLLVNIHQALTPDGVLF